MTQKNISIKTIIVILVVFAFLPSLAQDQIHTEFYQINNFTEMVFALTI